MNKSVLLRLMGWLVAAVFGFGLGMAVSTSSKIPEEVRQTSTSPTATAPSATTVPSPAAVKTGDAQPGGAATAPGPSAGEVTIGKRMSPAERHAVLARRAGDFFAAKRDAEYADLFAVLGLDAEASAELRRDLRAIVEAKAAAGYALSGVVHAQDAYDAKVKKLLGDKYADYRADEAAHPSRREYDLFSEFASLNSLPVTPAERTLVERLIANSQAYSLGNIGEFGDPYKPVAPAVGGENLEPFLSEKLADAKARSAAFLSAARSAGVSEATVSALQKYYQNEIEDQQLQLEMVKQPEIGCILALKRQLEILKSRPSPNLKLIQTLEAQLKGP